MDQRSADRSTLLHAAGQFVRVAIAEIAEADGVKQDAGAIDIRINWLTPQLDLEEHVAEQCPPVKQNRALEKRSRDWCKGHRRDAHR